MRVRRLSSCRVGPLASKCLFLCVSVSTHPDVMTEHNFRREIMFISSAVVFGCLFFLCLFEEVLLKQSKTARALDIGAVTARYLQTVDI